MGVRERKHALRERMAGARAEITPQERSRMASTIEHHLRGLPEVAAAGTIMLFSSFGSEVPTATMIERFLADGSHVLLPFVDERGVMEAAEIRAGDALVRTSYGPKEPPRREPADPAEIDVVVLPGLAFDRSGRRLGYGRGHYDRFLRRLRPQTLRVGVAFASQIVDEDIPVRPSDEVVDVVVTDTEVIRTPRT